MPTENNGFWNWIGSLSKITVYIMVAGMGLTSRLLIENKRKKLSFQEALLHTVLAAISVICTWYALKEAHASMSTTVVCSAMTARWGDSVSMVLFKHSRDFLKDIIKDSYKMKLLLTILLFPVWAWAQTKPTVNAGNDTTVNLPTAQITLHGTATPVAGKTIKAYSWAKVGKFKGLIVSPNSATTVFKNLAKGIYTLTLTVTQSNRVTNNDKVTITVDSSGVATLQANAGADQSISRFQGYAMLDGSASSGAITAFNWSMLTGVNEDGVGYIDNVSEQNTSTHLMPYGNYTFQLAVTNSTLTKTLATDQINQPCSFLKLNNTTSLSTGMTVFGQFIKGNTVINSIGHDTVFLSKAIIYPIYTGEVYTFATGSGDLSKDTTAIASTYGTIPPQRVSWHKVTSGTLAADRIAAPFCYIGNYIIDGANDGYNIGGNKTDIYIPAGTFSTLTGSTKILVKGGIYNDVNFDIGVGELTAGDTITNYGGQVQSKRFRFNNVTNCYVTGKYESGKTGDPSFTGWDGGYAFRDSTFGLYANNGWQSLQAPCLAFSGRAEGNKVTYFQYGHGGFAGFWYKDPNVTVDYDNVEIAYCYGINSGGEMAYFGQTNSDPTNQFNNLNFHDNVHARAGNEIFQIGQLGSSNYLHNNVGAMSATRWRSAFQESQYFGGQFGFRNGNNHVDSNVILGAGEQILSAIAYRKGGLSYDGGTLTFRANTWQYSKGFIKNYLQGVNGLNLIGMPIVIDSCVVGNSFFQEDSVFNQVFPGTATPIPNYTNTQQILRAAVDSNVVTMRKTWRDNTATTLIANAAHIDTSGTTAVSQLPTFDWNSGFDTSDYRTYSMWGNYIFASMGDEFTNQTVFRQGQKIYFNTGDMVCWLSKFYVSKIDGNWNHIPQGVTDAYWTLKTWNNGGNTVTCPPDDYRLSTGNFYYLRGIGLTQHQ